MYRAVGIKFLIADFGADYSDLNLLADFQPDREKIVAVWSDIVIQAELAKLFRVAS